MIGGIKESDTEDLRSIELVKGGEELGLIQLMDRYRQPIFRFCYRFVFNEAEAADLTEETFVRVFFKARSYRPKAKVSTWVYSIAGNLCRDFLRRQKKFRGNLSLDFSNETGDGPLSGRIASSDGSPDELLLAGDDLSFIQRQIHKLPYKLKFPFVFCVLEGHSYADCADARSISIKTVEMRIYRARKILQEKLSPLSTQF